MSDVRLVQFLDTTDWYDILDDTIDRTTDVMDVQQLIEPIYRSIEERKYKNAIRYVFLFVDGSKGLLLSNPQQW